MSTSWYIFLQILTMDWKNIYIVVFGLFLLALQCVPKQLLSRPGCTANWVHGYLSTLPMLHTGYPSTLPVLHTRYLSTLPMSHTGYPSTLPVLHTGYLSTLPELHTRYPFNLPVLHMDSTHSTCLFCSKEKLFSLDTAVPPFINVRIVLSPVYSLSPWILYQPSLLCQQLYIIAFIASSCCACHADRRRGNCTGLGVEHRVREGGIKCHLILDVCDMGFW